MEQNNPTNPTPAPPNADMQKKLLYGAIASLVLAIVYFCVATYIDNQTGTVRINAIIAVVYNTMGTIKGTALFGGISVVLFVIYFIKGMKK